MASKMAATPKQQLMDAVANLQLDTKLIRKQMAVIQKIRSLPDDDGGLLRLGMRYLNDSTGLWEWALGMLPSEQGILFYSILFAYSCICLYNEIPSSHISHIPLYIYNRYIFYSILFCG